MVRNVFSFFVLIQPFLLPSKSSRSPKTTPPHPTPPHPTPRSILLLLLRCLQWLPWIWWHRCVFPASILTSTASSHFSCGALKFRWVIKYTLLTSSSSYHSPMAPVMAHPFSIKCVKLRTTR
ncbi:unnamed protein product [Lactuca virosa]|uniref:Secreted protein n=1 Tax=Lactuca virosa TaxID=75947 RepID=A0AAU9NAN7_9ASTR|nr:unnamed protein product [Lactuca virosa]